MSELFNEQTKKHLNIPDLYIQDGKGDNAIAHCKFYDILGSWTWYVTEAEKQADGDYLFFGLVDGFEAELGYFRLSEFLSINKDFPRIERDLYFTPVTLGEIKRQIEGSN